MNSFLDAIVFRKLEKYGHCISYRQSSPKGLKEFNLYNCDKCKNIFGIKPGSENVVIIDNGMIHKYGDKDTDLDCENLIVKDIISN